MFWFQWFMARFFVPDDLAQITLIDLLAAVRAIVEMPAFTEEIPTIQPAGYGRSKV